jgi:hypothetical protein
MENSLLIMPSKLVATGNRIILLCCTQRKILERKDNATSTIPKIYWWSATRHLIRIGVWTDLTPCGVRNFREFPKASIPVTKPLVASTGKRICSITRQRLILAGCMGLPARIVILSIEPSAKMVGNTTKNAANIKRTKPSVSTLYIAS